MKIHKPNFGNIIIILIIVGFFGGLFAPKMQAYFSNSYLTLPDSIISLFLLFALCSISAIVILWAYSKLQLPQHPVLIFSLGLLISAVSASVRMLLGFQQAQYMFAPVTEQFKNVPLSTGYINFFAGGLESVLLTCAVISISLLWIARWKKTKHAPATLPSNENKKQDVILIIFTLVIYAFSIKYMLEFILMTALSWRLNSLR